MSTYPSTVKMSLEARDVFEGLGNIERLIEDLDAYFPPVNPQPTDTLPQIMYKAGQRSVVDYVKSLLKDDV
jgi:hypothetical protein